MSNFQRPPGSQGSFTPFNPAQPQQQQQQAPPGNFQQPIPGRTHGGMNAPSPSVGGNFLPGRGPPGQPQYQQQSPPATYGGPARGPPGNYGGPAAAAPRGPPTSMAGPPGGSTGNYGGPARGPPGNYGGPAAATPRGPPASMAGPPGSNYGGPAAPRGPPASMAGPPGGNYGGPPSSMAAAPRGPPASMAGPPGGSTGNYGGPARGPPGNYGGPAAATPRGPPVSMSGPPGGNYGGPAAPRGPHVSMAGPPGGNYGGPPSSMAAAPRGPPSGMGGFANPPTNSPPPPQQQFQAAQHHGVSGLPPTMTSSPGPAGPKTFSPKNVPPPPTSNQMPAHPPSNAFGQMSLNGQPGNSQQQQPPGYQQGYQQQPPGYQQQQPPGYQQQQPPGYQQQQQPPEVGLSEANLAAQCAPSYMRMSVTSIPHSQENATKSHLPLGITIRPMANESEEPLEVVNFGASGVVRCKRCRTYINPFVQWIDNGRRWRCNLCGIPNDVHSSYFCHLDERQQRQDLDQRPELRCGSVEIVAPAEYMMRPPQPPVFVFVINVSSVSIQSGMLSLCLDTIKEKLDDLCGAPRTRVGFVTYDSTIQFYNLKAGMKTPQIMVVPDITDLFIPIPDDLLVNLR